MKRLLLALLLLSGHAFSQEPPKKASKIIVLIKDTSATISKIAKTLFDKGFTIDTKDDIAKTLSTKEFAPNHPSIHIKIRVSVNDTSAIFTGTYAWTLTSGLYPSPHEYALIEFRGMKKSAAMQAWNSLDAIAKSFGDNIVYSN